MAGQTNSKMLFIAPANPATQLVQVAQTKVMRVIDDDCVYVRNVNTTFHDVGANKHVVLLSMKSRILSSSSWPPTGHVQNNRSNQGKAPVSMPPFRRGRECGYE